MKPISFDDPRYVKAMSHPVRVRIMTMLQERAASPKQLSEWLGTTVGASAYHVRILEALGLIELVRETRVRGAVEHHYRATVRPKLTVESWSSASPIAKQTAISAQLKMLEDHTNASAAAGGFDRPDAVLERKSARVDDHGWNALVAESAKFLDRIDKIEAAAAERIATAGENGTIDAGLVLLSFESVALASQIPEPKVTPKPMRRIRRS